MIGPLHDRVALVTGAASPQGMGFASARKLASLGAQVVLTDTAAGGVNAERLHAGAQRIVQDGGHAQAMLMDVTDAEAVNQATDAIARQFGGIDILFGNAGIGRTGGFLEMPDSDWELLYRVNQKGMVTVCRAVIPHMIARGGGSIVLNSSMSGLSGIAQYTAYTMTKFAVIGLMKCLADEFGNQGIRCNAICPGNIATEMGLREIRERAEHLGIGVDEARAVLEKECALGRMGTPEDVANTVAFLAGPDSSFLSGVAVPIAGAMYQGI